MAQGGGGCLWDSMLICSSSFALCAGAFDMAAEFVAHGRQQLLAETVVDAGAEAGIERRGDHRRRHRFVDRRIDGPAAFAGIIHLAC